MKKLATVFLDFDDIKNPLLNAGQARATYEVGSRLAKKGHQVTVIASKFPGYQDRVENGILYKHISFGSSNIRLNNLLYILNLPFYARKIKADLILECFTAPISTLFTPLWTNTPVMAIPTSFEAERFASVYKFPFDLIERFGLRFYKYFSPYTPYLDLKMKKYNSKVISKIIPQGVGEEFFQIKKSKPKHILYLGRIDLSQKGLDLLLLSFAKVKDQISYPLVIAGNGPDEEKVANLINKLQLKDKVKMVGPTYGDKKSIYLSQAVLVAFPSRHEGFSLFSLEALASGLPLVSFDIPGLSWAESNVALKANCFDVNQYAQFLLSSNNTNLMDKMSKNARDLAKQYSWDKVTDQFESFFMRF